MSLFGSTKGRCQICEHSIDKNIESEKCDLNQWKFRFENSDPRQIVPWLKGKSEEYPEIFLSWLKEEDPPTVNRFDSVTNASDIHSSSDSFPIMLSPHSVSSTSSSYTYNNHSPPYAILHPKYSQSVPSQNIAKQCTTHPQTFNVSYSSEENVTLRDLLSQSPKSPETKAQFECSNCQTKTTSLWRCNAKTGERECNACNLYERVNGQKRPSFYWKDTVYTRKKKGSSKHHDSDSDVQQFIF